MFLTNEDKRIYNKNLEGINRKKVEKRKVDEFGKEARISVDRETIYPKLIGEQRPRVSGPLNKLLVDGK